MIAFYAISLIFIFLGTTMSSDPVASPLKFGP